MSTALIDASLLLTPINENTPSGEDMSFSTEFDKIQEARREDDPSLDQGEWVTQIKEADWSAALNLCQSLLQQKTKDLRIALWYCEAAVNLYDIAGLHQGFRLCAGLLENFWDNVHPQPEDGDQEQRIGNLSLFLKRATELLKNIPLVRGRGHAFGLQALEGARLLQAQLDRGEEGSDERVTLQQFKDAQKATPRSFYQQTLQDCSTCKASLAAFSLIADQRLGLDGPSFSMLNSAFEDYADTIARLAKENGIIDPELAGLTNTDTNADLSDQDDDGNEKPHSNNASGPIRNRDQALHQLRVVAEFFRRTEPHSPVAYLADKAARWGEMPLHVWLKAVLKEDGALARFEDLLGVADLPEAD